MRVGTAIIDMSTGMWLVIGVISALLARSSIIRSSTVLFPVREHRADFVGRLGLTRMKDQAAPFCQGVRPRYSCGKPSVRAPKVRSCSKFASDLRDVAALKARARKFVL